ncbi:hypothetical protein BDC45DRAFT_536545 [Circinella umbellata]|nr:hypothetical protein BDC45DRAFT_536545 [Circinella umbellata]
MRLEEYYADLRIYEEPHNTLNINSCLNLLTKLDKDNFDATDKFNGPQKENFIIQSAYHNIVEVVSTMLYLQYNVYAHKKLGMNLLINRSMDLHELPHFIEFHVNSDHGDSWKSIHFYYSF